MGQKKKETSRVKSIVAEIAHDLGFNKKLFDYAKQNAVEKFIFADLEKKNYVQIGMDAIIREGSEDNYGYGLNWYVPMTAGIELDTYTPAPYFDKKENAITL